ncbi:hypothetical protein DACRYDRAFT_57484 [Dacryopinax primogenitus]|uniref:Uncharacterized protein n=1 Tax=Dacryopinax primogenitus (strain DJM 731) TaxID=1858805 RepID=M5FPC6_DACPD|nr:uncharacterized protein DACRYDRAFT_57484 [Dacryopinax primogenitus]EJT98440.1 hypothetical protein DACRYDRAFT_57484 [Dacryopinax primogenitus]
MSRLASLHGPSTPSSSPRNVSRGSPVPDSPQAAPIESPFHRKLRSSLRDIAGAIEGWDEMVLGEGLRAVKGVVDNGTALDNALASNPNHRSFIATPRIQAINAHLKTLNALCWRLEKQFRLLTMSVDALESLIMSTAAARGPLFLRTPVWISWTPEHFLNALLSLPRRYHQSLITISQCVEKLKDPDISWDEGKDAVQTWADQREIRAKADELDWTEIEEIFVVEVRGWADG